MRNNVAWDSTFKLSSWGIKSATPSDNYAEWDVTFNLSSWGIKSATPSWPLCWLGYYLQLIFMRDEIRHPLWPLYWMGSYLQLIFLRDQIRHPLTTNYVDCDITFHLSSSGIKSATPSDNYVEWVEKDFAACSSGHCIAYKIQSHTLAILAILLFQFCARDYVAVSIRVFCFRLQVGFRSFRSTRFGFSCTVFGFRLTGFSFRFTGFSFRFTAWRFSSMWWTAPYHWRIMGVRIQLVKAW